MKPLYSLILTAAFLAGAIQPIVPLLEYHVFKQSIIDLLCENRDVPGSDCDGFCYLSKQIQESEERNNETSGTHADYYPGCVLNDGPQDLLIFPGKTDFLSQFSGSPINSEIRVNSPPPQIS
jgi:hypothetical protein